MFTRDVSKPVILLRKFIEPFTLYVYDNSLDPFVHPTQIVPKENVLQKQQNDEGVTQYVLPSCVLVNVIFLNILEMHS